MKALKINQVFLYLPFFHHSAHNLSEHRNLLGVFGNTAGSTVKLCCFLFNLFLTVLGHKELQQIMPAGSCSDTVAHTGIHSLCI